MFWYRILRITNATRRAQKNPVSLNPLQQNLAYKQSLGHKKNKDLQTFLENHPIYSKYYQKNRLAWDFGGRVTPHRKLIVFKMRWPYS